MKAQSISGLNVLKNIQAIYLEEGACCVGWQHILELQGFTSSLYICDNGTVLKITDITSFYCHNIFYWTQSLLALELSLRK